MMLYLFNSRLLVVVILTVSFPGILVLKSILRGGISLAVRFEE